MARMQIQEMKYNDSLHTDTNALSQAMLLRPDIISPHLTYLSGNWEEKYPLMMLAEGTGAKSVESLENDEYQYPIIGKPNRVIPLAQDVTVTGAGINGASFTMKFREGWFPPGYVITGPSGFPLKTIDRKEVNGLYEYTVRPLSASGQSVPADDLKAGARYAQMYAPVAKDYSDGLASNWVAPGVVRHKLTTLRKSYHFSGNVANQVVVFDLPTQTGTSKFWMDFEEYQYFIQWMEECETYYWYGSRSYNENGETHLTDENGNPVVVGPGLLEQIPNKETYSILSEKLLKEIIGDLYYGMTSPKNQQVTLFTGTGGFRMFDEAMKNFIRDNTHTQYNPQMFVTGTGRNLELGGFFKRYQHVDGHAVNIVKTNMFDHGPLAQTSPPHPEFGNLPLESFRMVFVDQSTYNGNPNLRMFAKKGREMKRWVVQGGADIRGMDTGPARASAVDGASVHFLKTAHICLQRFDTSLDLQCKIA